VFSATALLPGNGGTFTLNNIQVKPTHPSYHADLYGVSIMGWQKNVRYPKTAIHTLYPPVLATVMPIFVIML